MPDERSSDRQRSLNELASRSEHLLSLSIAPKTRNNYNGGFKRYTLFCRQHNIKLFPVVEATLILLTTDLSYTLAHDSIKVHLSGIAFHAAILGNAFDIKLFKRLYYLLRGIKRSQGRSKKRRKRAPVTPMLLKAINVNLFNSGRVYEDKIMLWAALLTAFYGFLRVSVTPRFAKLHMILLRLSSSRTCP